MLLRPSHKFNPCTLKSGQFQIPLHHHHEREHRTVWGTWLVSDKRWNMIVLPIRTTSLIHFSLKVRENVRFEHCSGVALSGERHWCFQRANSPDYGIVIFFLTVEIIESEIEGLLNFGKLSRPLITPTCASSKTDQPGESGVTRTSRYSGPD